MKNSRLLATGSLLAIAAIHLGCGATPIAAPPAQAFQFLAGGGPPGFADGVGGAARFSLPAGIAADSMGNFIVADTGNNAIRRVTPAGVVTTIAGNGQAGAADGVGAAATFNAPIDVVVVDGDVIIVQDAGNNLFRRISTDGTVTTIGPIRPSRVPRPQRSLRQDQGDALSAIFAVLFLAADIRDEERFGRHNAEGLNLVNRDGTAEPFPLPAPMLPAGAQPVSTALGDLNGDGTADLVTIVNQQGVDKIHTNLDPERLPHFPGPNGLRPLSITTERLNGDAFADLAYVATDNGSQSCVGILPGLGDGAFGPGTMFPLPAGAVPGDLTISNTGGNDVLVTDRGIGHGVKVLRNVQVNTGTGVTTGKQLPTGQQDQPYSGVLPGAPSGTILGGRVRGGALPPGTRIVQSGNTFTLTETPTASGTFTFTFRFDVDGVGSVLCEYTVTINPPGGGGEPGPGTLGTVSPATLNNTHIVGTTPCPQAVGTIRVANTSTQQITYVASSNNPRFFIANPNGVIGASLFEDLVVMFDCEAFPPQQGMVTIVLNSATATQMFTVDVNLAAGMQSRVNRPARTNGPLKR